MTIRIDGTNTAANPGITGTDTDTGLQFGTDEVNVVTGGSTRATVDSSGRLGIATTTPGSLDAFGDDLVIGDGSGHRGATIYSGTGSQGVIYFADGTTGGDVARGKVFYSHSDNYLAFDTDATERMRIDSSGNLRFNSGYGSVATAYGVRAWVCFNGNNGTVLEDGNVSSVTDNATGNYTINFATSMPDSNYAATGASDSSGGGDGVVFGPPATGSIQMDVFDQNGVLRDHDKVFAIIVR
jgi:hypothetical protein